ncbi:glycerol-3-phosphate dehydrogenase/oxidase [Polaribacter gochangensis]|uniref:glycerol-3-phosphate dehydrogenase/oxidase n=1 Tax=Polaribacter gochangensis TaxID=3252903 RepID=UPI003904A24C
MNNKELEETHWDVLIIGGGATGVGVAIDAASRGYKTLLVEQSDFGKGTSSKSTKLIHGGVRYLQQGNISLVLESLKERAILKKNAPHIVHDLNFVVPTYDWWESPFYGIGLKLYDLLAGKEGFGKSEFLSKEETISYLPTIEQEGLQGGILYHDGQFDDTRLLMSMLLTAENQGATLLNYTELISLTKKNAKISGGIIKDVQTKSTFEIKAKVVVNATGVFADAVRKKDLSGVNNRMTGSRGTHIVLDKSFLKGETAIMIPHTKDGRVLFAVPWHDKLLIGTTDVEVQEYNLDPVSTEEEISFLLNHTAKYLTKDPTRKDIKSIFSGLRPLVKNDASESSSEISREHQIEISENGLVSILGGKWTTYRKMAKDVVNKASTFAGLPRVKSETHKLQLNGFHENSKIFKALSIYGSDALKINKISAENPELKEKLHKEYSIIKAQIVFAVRNEKAKTIEDFLARRTRLLFLDAKTSLDVAPVVAEIMAKELGENEVWIQAQLISYQKVASTYLP